MGMPSVLITGAGRGLGLEFARQYAADGWRVLACAREPDKLELKAIGGAVSRHRLDVTDPADVAALATELAGEAIDVLINNAGIYGQPKGRGGFGDIDYAVWEQVMRVNVLAPMRVVEALLPQVERGQRKTLAFVSSRMGSIAENPGGVYVYRSSKTALNAVVKGLAGDLKPKGVIAVACHPGWVRTDMGGPGATLSSIESVTGLRRVILGLTPADSGRFLNHDGSAIPW
jgi:NAD(P)-dependent dehydrogenase (short-subunit alcohol dehydrogenase family)